MDSAEEDEEEDKTTVSVLRKKKRILTNYQNSFFSGCNAIKEES